MIISAHKRLPRGSDGRHLLGFTEVSTPGERLPPVAHIVLDPWDWRRLLGSCHVHSPNEGIQESAELGR